MIFATIKKHINPFHKETFADIRLRQLSEAKKERDAESFSAKYANYNAFIAQAKIDAIIKWEQQQERESLALPIVNRKGD